ncbi:MAG: hypothetical protein H7256_09380 [Bdellovibrio sp.]|nr:hypothetical protein [Bdellovibrio sp.]
MGGTFMAAVFFRWAIYYTVRRHEWFAREFEKRAHKFLDSEVGRKSLDISFYNLTKKVLEKTYYEVFAVRDRGSQGDNQKVMALSDRVFLIKPGCAWMVKDVLKQLRYLKWSKETPKLLHITKSSIDQNPCFNKVFGIIPMSAMNDLIGMLPGLFIVTGILGTFLGIKGGLVSLGGMDMSDMEGTKSIMDSFLHEIGYAMSSSIVGIAFSLLLHLVNVSLSPERVFSSLCDRFENTMDLLWYRSDNNQVVETNRFDENRDPVEALAEEALNLEISKSEKTMTLKAS